MTATLVLCFVGFVLVAWWALTSLAERTAEWRKTRGIRRSGRAAAKDRHPAGKQRPGVDVFDQYEKPGRAEEGNIHIPQSVEVREHGQGKSVAEAAAADPIRIHLEATWAMPVARKEGAS